jgi:hypothetical protein
VLTTKPEAAKATSVVPARPATRDDLTFPEPTAFGDIDVLPDLVCGDITAGDKDAQRKANHTRWLSA